MRGKIDSSALLEAAEDELRRAILAERAEIKGAGIRRQRAEIEVDRWRRRVAVERGTVEMAFGPGDRP